MRDTWIDDHTGDETVARPDFEAELRSQLAKEFVTPARRSTPSTRTAWRAIGWASVAAAAAVAGVVVLNGDDKGRTVVPGATTPGGTTSDTSTPSTTVVPGNGTLDVPPFGGPPLEVDIIATVPYDLADAPPVVALLSDGILVLPVDELRFDGTVRVFDREGNPWGETMLAPVPDGLAATALGAPGTLYVVTLSEIDNSQIVHAYQHNGTVWSETNVTVISDNNDASYTVSSEGLMLGSELVMAATPPIQDAARAEWLIRQGNTVVERVEPDGTSVTWRVIEQFENFSTPPIVHPFDNGVIYMGNASGEVANRYIGVLGADGTTAFYRPGPWMLAGVDESTALFTQVVDGQLQLGRIGFGARPTQIDWAEGAVLGTPIGYYGPDTLQERINPVLGEPTADSGWFVVEAIAPGDEDCLAGQELRVLHWGDLTVAFKKGVTPDGLEGEQMWSWVVGDLRASGFSSFREPVAAPIGTPTGLHTEDGFGVGSSIDDLQGEGDVLLSDFVNADGSRGGYFTPATGTDVSSSRSFVIDAGGAVIGFGATQAFC